MQNYRIK